MKSDLPKFIVVIKYSGKSLAAERKKKDKGEELNGYKRYLYVYSHEELNERMGKAWREDATAEVYGCTNTLQHKVKASARKGIWE